MKIRLTKGMKANDSLIDYFGRGPEADGYSIEKEATFCALPKISEYRRSGVAGSPLLHRVLRVKKSNATKEEKEQFNLSFSNLLRLGAINGGKKELPFNRSIEFWDFVIDVPKHVTILGFVLGRVDVLQLVDNLRSELLCDLLKELRVKPKVDERVIDILQPPQQNYLIEFPHFVSRLAVQNEIAKASEGDRGSVPDPQMHWHHLLPNLAQSADDGALRPLWPRRMAKMMQVFSSLYRNKLLLGLRSLDIPAVPDQLHQIIIKDVAPSVIKDFSQRSIAINEEIAKLGLKAPKQRASVSSRKRIAKSTELVFSTLCNSWYKRLAAHGREKPFEVPYQLEVEPLEPAPQIIGKFLNKQPIVERLDLYSKLLDQHFQIDDLNWINQGLKGAEAVFLQRRRGDFGLICEESHFNLARRLTRRAADRCYKKSEEIWAGSKNEMTSIHRWLAAQSSLVIGVDGISQAGLLSGGGFDVEKVYPGIALITELTRDPNPSRALVLDGLNPQLVTSNSVNLVDRHCALGTQIIIQQGRGDSVNTSKEKDQTPGLGLLDVMHTLGFPHYYSFPVKDNSRGLGQWLTISEGLEDNDFLILPSQVILGFDSLLRLTADLLKRSKPGDLFIWFPEGEQSFLQFEKLVNVEKSFLPTWKMLISPRISSSEKAPEDKKSRSKTSLHNRTVYAARLRQKAWYLKTGAGMVGPVYTDFRIDRSYLNGDGSMSVPSSEFISGVISYGKKLPPFRSFPSRLIIGLSADYSLEEALSEVERTVSKSSSPQKPVDITIGIDCESDVEHMLESWKRHSEGSCSVTKPTEADGYLLPLSLSQDLYFKQVAARARKLRAAEESRLRSIEAMQAQEQADYALEAYSRGVAHQREHSPTDQMRDAP